MALIKLFMKRVILFIVIVAFCTTRAFSQTSIQETVYLKNGSVIKGLVIEQVPNEHVKVQTKDGSIFVYDASEVEKITKEANSRSSYKNEDYSRKGFIGLSIGPSFPIGDYSELPIGLNLSLIDFGYLFNKNIGIAGKWFGTAHAEEGVTFGLGGLLVGPLGSVPVTETINFEGKLLGGAGAFVASYDGESDTSDGYFAYDIGIGFRFNTSEKMSVLVNADLIGAEDYKTINLSVGIAFRLK